MREKILAQLVAKYSGVSKKFLGLWADKLQSKVTEESQIEGVIGELENLPVSIPDLAAEYQKEGDARVSEAKKQWATNPPKPDLPPTPPKTDPPAPDDTAALLKQLLTEVNNLKAEKAKGTIQEKFKANPKLKDIPEALYKGRALPEKEEELEAFVDEIVADHKALEQSLIDKGFAQQSTPISGVSGSKTVDADIAAWAQQSAEPEKK